jgi:hypothetical protein
LELFHYPPNTSIVGFIVRVYVKSLPIMKFRFGATKRPTTDAAEIIGDDADQNSGREVPQELQEKITTAPQHEQLTDDQAARKLKMFRHAAIHDPNLPTEDIDRVDDAVDAHNVDKENVLVEDLMENSPYPEVSFRMEQHCLCVCRVAPHDNLTLFNRFAHPSATMMFRCRPILFARGFLV